MTPRHTSMAETLRQAIESSEQSVCAIAKGADVAQPVLHRFVKGERDLTLRTAEKLAVFFNLELRPRRRS